MGPSRLAAALLTAAMAAQPALAQEYATYQFLERPQASLQPCGGGMLLTMPEGWEAGDGAVVLLSTQPSGNAVRDALVSTLLYEHAAVLEVAPTPCAGATPTMESVIHGAGDALAAMKRVMGSGMVVAIGYGPGSAAMLDLVRAPRLGQPGAEPLRYAAAVALGDGAPAFALGEAPPGEDAPARPGALCRALAGLAGGMGRMPERVLPASAAEACIGTMAAGTAPAARTIRATFPH